MSDSELNTTNSIWKRTRLIIRAMINNDFRRAAVEADSVIMIAPIACHLVLIQLFVRGFAYDPSLHLVLS
jgi:hypothetical protein